MGLEFLQMHLTPISLTLIVFCPVTTYRFIRLGYIVDTNHRVSKQTDVKAMVILCPGRCKQWTPLHIVGTEKESHT